MTKANTRIRWTEDERNSVLAAYRTLQAREPHGDITKHFASAQKALPPKRRRTLDYTLRVWLQTDGAHARGRPPAAKSGSVPPIPSAKPSTNKTPVRAETSPKSGSTFAVVPPSTASRPDGAHATLSGQPDSAALEKLLVERGSEIVADILGSVRVQQALRALLRAAWPTATADTPGSALTAREASTATGEEPMATAPPANGKLRILIAGMDKSEGALLAKTYDDSLALVSWSADEGLEGLRAAVDRADVVVGMTHALSQPVEQTLRRYSKRYLRNVRGIAGLRGELAELVLSGPVASTAESADTPRA